MLGDDNMQKYIELGRGYAEIFELEQLIQYNKPRIDKAILLTHGETPATFLLIMQPARDHFQAVYTIYKGISMSEPQKKLSLIKSWLKDADIQLVTFDTKHPDEFYEPEQYYQYITGILRLNHLIPNML